MADKAYDVDKLLEQARQQGMEIVIPPKKNRREPRKYDSHLYRHRHLAENAFLFLKQWRGIAFRYAKNLSSKHDRNRGIKSINNALGVVRHILNLAAGEWFDEHGLSLVTDCTQNQVDESP